MNEQKLLSVHISPTKGGEEVIERLRELADERNRSLNYLVIQAILEHLDDQGV